MKRPINVRLSVFTLLIMLIAAAVAYGGAIKSGPMRATRRIEWGAPAQQGPIIRLWTVDVEEGQKYYFSADTMGKSKHVVVHRCVPDAGNQARIVDSVTTDTTAGHHIGYPDNEDQFFYVDWQDKNKKWHLLQANEGDSGANTIADGNGVKMWWSTPDGPIYAELNKE